MSKMTVGKWFKKVIQDIHLIYISSCLNLNLQKSMEIGQLICFKTGIIATYIYICIYTYMHICIYIYTHADKTDNLCPSFRQTSTYVIL